jgi:hypothetical protein
MIPHKRKVTFVVIGIALVAFCALASDSWKNTPYEKWSAKDVQMILNDSPWAKSITVPYSPFLNGNSQEADHQIKIGTASDPKELSDSRIYKPDGIFILRWNSAITLRRALYRDAVLHGIPADYAASRYLQNDPEFVELVLVPVGQTLLPPTEQSNLMSETQLQFQPSGKMIRPTSTQVRAQVNSLGQEGYVFDFPKQLPDGSPIIPKGTTQIEFFTQVGVRRFGAKFKTGDMAVHDTPDYF